MGKMYKMYYQNGISCFFFNRFYLDNWGIWILFLFIFFVLIDFIIIFRHHIFLYFIYYRD